MFHFFRLTVRASVDGTVSDLYLPQYFPDPFHFYTSDSDSDSDSHLINQPQDACRVLSVMLVRNLNFRRFLSQVVTCLGMKWILYVIVWVIRGNGGSLRTQTF